MGFFQDVRSGRFVTWAKIAAIISFIVLIIVGVFSLLSVYIAFGIAAMIIGVLMMFLEVPWLTACCTGPTMMAFSAFFQKSWLRALLYAVFSTVMWLSLFIGAGTLIIPALLLAFTAILYILASFRRDDKPASGSDPLTPGAEKERPSNPTGAGYANVV